MKHDDLSWLAAELGLPLLEETADGRVVEGAARAELSGRPGSITQAVAALVGIPEDDPKLVGVIAEARDGARRSALVGPGTRNRSWRVLAQPVPGASDCLRVVLAPMPDETPARERIVDVAAAVSHEVANAVGSIRGWADLALQGGEPGERAVDLRDALTLIASAARNAEHAARGMLTLARAGAGASADAAQPLDLSDIARDLLQLLTLTAREARVTVTSQIAPALSVSASRAQLFTIMFNLIKNAIEACKPGGEVSVQLEGDDEHVRFSVRDTGEGLDRAGQQRLFEPYYTTKVNGTGIGLVLVRDAVRDSGATLDVESERGRGTVFRVSFPRVVPETAETSRVERNPTGEASRQPLHARVLVVDDDHALREMLATALSLRGAEVVSARSSEEALALAGPFDIALVDMLLDGSRGDELLATLRQRGVVQAAMLVTGTVQKPRLVPGGEPDDWVRKPFEIPHLVERMRRTLERHRMLHAARSSARM